MKKISFIIWVLLFVYGCASHDEAKNRKVASDAEPEDTIETTEKIDRSPATFGAIVPFEKSHLATQKDSKAKDVPSAPMTKVEDFGGCQLGFANVFLNNRGQNPLTVGDMMALLPQGKISGTHNLDRQYLKQWFLGHAYDAVLLEMAKYSKGFTAALELVHGPVVTCEKTGRPCAQSDYRTALQMAGILAMIRATAHDAECAKAIKKWGITVLNSRSGTGASNSKNGAYLDELKVEAAAAALQSGTLQAEFKKLHDKKEAIDMQELEISSVLEKFEDENRQEKQKIERELLRAFDELDLRFQKIPTCRQKIKRQKLLASVDPSITEKELIESLKNACLTALDERSKTLAAKQARILGSRAENDQNPETDRTLKEIEEEAKSINEYRISITDKKDPGSVALQLDEVTLILDRKIALNSNPEIKKLQTQAREKENEKGLIANDWLIFGLLGGFDSASE
jgi:hypothetical protein